MEKFICARCGTEYEITAEHQDKKLCIKCRRELINRGR